ncbi:hypothetical protein [Burkholderia sp. BCC1998]|nr:hypothetical protein [Burkholderia sp. BCC1998]
MTRDSVRLAALIPMPHSHYSEKARWVDRLALPYRETLHVPLLH